MSPQQIFFFDSRVAGWSSAVQSLPPGSMWFALDPSRDGLEQVLLALTGFSDLKAIHIISHGSAGRVELGASELSTDTLGGHADTLAQIGKSLSPGGDLLLYGCDVAAGLEGLTFIERLSTLAGVDVAASDDATGNESFGGNWLLERTAGVGDSIAAQRLGGLSALLQNTPPVVGVAVPYVENAPPVPLGASVSVYDSDLAPLNGGLGNYAGSTLSLSRRGGANPQDLFSATGNLTLNTATGQMVLSGQVIGTFTNAAGTLAIAFNGNATQARVNEAVASFGYANASDAPPASVVIEWGFNDGNTGDQGTGGALVATGSTIVTIIAVNDSATGAVTISGTPTQGQTLTAANTLADLEGIPASGAGAIAYQWNANGSPVTGANGSTFTPTQAQVGQVITVTARYTDNQGTAESVTSSATTAVANVNDAPTGAVTITGTPTQGQTLTAANTLADVDGIPSSGTGAIAYQWSAGGIAIAGATGSTFTLGQAQVGQVITVAARYTDNQGTVENVTSSATATVANVNDAPTGAVTMTGTPAQGQTLSALSTLADLDGIPNSGAGAMSYQWRANGSAIAGATGSTLLLTQGQVGQVITVTVTYTDNQGAAETVTSSATAAVANVNDGPMGSVTITGTPAQGQTLTAANTLADLDGIPASGTGAIAYQWNAGGVAIIGSTGSTLTLTQAQVGQAITVTARYTDIQGTVENVTSGATQPVANVNDPPTGTVSITGTATQGQTLTASNNLIDMDGIPSSGAGAIAYQWNADATAIAGATGSTLTLTQAQAGKVITVTARYTDNQGTAESVTSSATLAVSDINDPPTGTVTVTGTPAQGQTLSVSNSLADPEGIPSSGPGAISYQWRANGSPIAGATGSSLPLTQSQVGQTITVTAAYIDNLGTSESVTSNATAAVANVNDNPTGVVTITGTPAQGQTLTASNTLADMDGIPASGTGAIAYQWSAGGTAITGATSNTLTLSQVQVSKVITVTARYTDNQGTIESVTSSATTAVVNVNDNPTGTVTISGIVTQGQTLTASNTLTDVDGIPTSGAGAIAYQWNGGGTAIAGATGSTLVLTQAQVGQAISVTARYTDNQGTAENITSRTTATVANVNDNPTGVVTITGTPTQGQTLTAFNILVDVDGIPASGAGAIAYQWNAGGAAISGATGSTLTLTQAQVGKVITVTARYTDSQGTVESVTSSATTSVANVNDNPTGAVTITGTATQGQTLTAANTLADVDGIPTSGTGAIAYQWSAGGVPIAGATTSTLTLAQAQVGKALTVTARYTDQQSTVESVTSGATTSVANVNDLPTGTVTITGTATQGQTLTAANTLADVDGIPASGIGAITYQWNAGGTAIAGATGNTLVLTQAQVGKAITVTARYTDNQGTVENVTSSATATVVNVNDLPTGTVTITGTAAQGQTLTASNTLADVDGIPASGAGAIAYQWNAAGAAIIGATGNTLTLTQAQVGQVITVTARYTDNQGTAETITSAASAAVANVNDAPTGAVIITGTPTQGQTLTAANTLADVDGIPASGTGVIAYQWSAGGTPITGATGSTLLLTQTQVGQAVTVTARYTDNQGTVESVTSSVTAPVANVNDAPTGTVTIAGTPTQGQTLTAANTLADVDGIPTSGTGAIAYQWSADGVTIAGATSSTLTLAQAQVGKALTVTARYTDQQGTVENVTSSATAKVANVNDSPTGVVTITGTATQGQTLTASNTLADIDGIPTSGTGSIAYQWSAGGAPIAGATGSSLTLTQTQVGKALTVTARYTDSQGTVENVTSSATASVANVNDPPTGTVVITGLPKQGQTLTASNTLADVDGIPASGTDAIAYQWNANGVPITGATSSTFTLTQAQVGQVITVTARYTDNPGWAESVTSPATAAVVNLNGQIPDEPRPVSGLVQDGYVAGAAIYLDKNGNGLPEVSEDTGLRTDASGNFSGTVSGSGVLLAVGGTNIDTGLRNALTLAAPQGATVVSPVTTLMQALGGPQGLSSAQTATKFAQAFGVTGVDLLKFDPLASGAGATGLAVQKINAQIALTASLSGAADSALQAVARLVAQTAGPLNLSDPAVLAQALGGLNLSAGVLAAIAQGNTNIRASNSLTEVSQVQKTTVLAALNPTTDWLAPTVTTFNPVTGTQAVPVSADLVFELSEPAQRGSGTIELRTADGSLVQRFEAGSAAVTVQGNTLTLNPSADLTPSTGYVVVFAPNAFLDLAGNSFAGLGDFSFSTAQAQDGGDGSPPVATRFGPAGSTRSVALNDNLTLTFNELIQTGPGAIRLKTASSQLVETFTAANATVSGSTLTLNPTGNLDLFTRYVLELDPNAVRDLAGNGISVGLNYDFRTASADGLYHIFVAAFAAAPGVTYMGQLAEAYNHFNALSTQAGNATSTLQQIVEIFTTKSQFTSVFPETLSDRELAVRLVNRIVKTSATDAARTQAIQDIEAALGIGWSRGKMLYTVFGNVANMPLNDPTWGNTAKQFQNQLAVSRYYTEVLAVDTTDLARLQGVLTSITPDTDVSTVEKIVQIIGTMPPGG